MAHSMESSSIKIPPNLLQDRVIVRMIHLRFRTIRVVPAGKYHLRRHIVIFPQYDI